MNCIAIAPSRSYSYRRIFDALGKEEYLGIVVDEPLDLPELTPDPINPALEWQGKHLERVWEKLRNKNWQVFYRDFEVISSEEAA